MDAGRWRQYNDANVLTGIAHGRPDGVAGVEELHDEPGADEARRPRHHHRPFRRARASLNRLRHVVFLGALQCVAPCAASSWST